MKVYKYLLSVIVMLGMISCSSEENDIINEVAPTAGQLTVAFNLSNEVATTKAVGDPIAPTKGEGNINTCALFICTAQEGEIIEKGFFNGSSFTFNFKPQGTQTDYYVYAVANVSKETFSGIGVGASVSDLKDVTASIPTGGASASNLPKMGGMPFTIELNSSEVQNIGEIPVYQLVSSLQLQMKTAFTGGNAEFVVTDIKWSYFSASGKIGGVNSSTDGSLSDESAEYEIHVSAIDWVSVGSQLYTFPNISSDAVLFVQGYISQNGEKIGDLYSHSFQLNNVTLEANTKYNVQITATGTLSNPTDVSFGYEIIEAESISVSVPEFN